MKKILMIIMFILLCVMFYFICFRGIAMGDLKVNSVKDIKNMSIALDEKKNEATEATNKTYPSTLAELKQTINSLNIAKNKYNEKIKYLGDGINVNAIQIEKYKIEFLWTRLGNYADEHQVKMQMDVIEQGEGIYDLDFHLIGSYINVTDFLYDIEEDVELNFKISDFKLLPDNTKTTTTISKTDGTTTNVDAPYSSTVSITEEENVAVSKNTDSDTDNDDNKDNEKTANQSNTKIVYSPKRLEASFKVYGVEINFN